MRASTSRPAQSGSVVVREGQVARVVGEGELALVVLRLHDGQVAHVGFLSRALALSMAATSSSEPSR